MQSVLLYLEGPDSDHLEFSAAAMGRLICLRGQERLPKIHHTCFKGMIQLTADGTTLVDVTSRIFVGLFEQCLKPILGRSEAR